MLAAEMLPHVDMASGGLVSSVETHSSCPLVVAINVCGMRISEAKMQKEHTKTKRLLGGLLKGRRIPPLVR